jgi:hypothetical protein
MRGEPERRGRGNGAYKQAIWDKAKLLPPPNLRREADFLATVALSRATLKEHKPIISTTALVPLSIIPSGRRLVSGMTSLDHGIGAHLGGGPIAHRP